MRTHQCLCKNMVPKSSNTKNKPKIQKHIFKWNFKITGRVITPHKTVLSQTKVSSESPSVQLSLKHQFFLYRNILITRKKNYYTPNTTGLFFDTKLQLKLRIVSWSTHFYVRPTPAGCSKAVLNYQKIFFLIQVIREKATGSLQSYR